MLLVTVWVCHASDFANSLMQETSQQATGFVSRSGESCLHVQSFCRRAIGRQQSRCNEGFSKTRLCLEASRLCSNNGALNTEYKPERGVWSKTQEPGSCLMSNMLPDFRHFPVLNSNEADICGWRR